MTALLESISQRLDELSGRGRARSLKLPAGVDFCSNDYLGLSRHPAMAQALRSALDRRVPVG